ncbi:DNA mismatch repair protein MutS [Halovenus aranensis]|uniref:DNA mismatch repair protein MutS n=1 Tax=Halovenus aranensis TaxID=890420 RepID=A0A1G8VEX0_9EURY|nr:DNA mismatch repair protein MutS [Halovenus aranensis]SDJ64631.1 DNA mismatch repair protein MutS [Halovenus aranensis]
MDDALGPPEKMAERREELTPMMTQYFELCTQYNDSLVLFQVGDFYEAFCAAAETVARRCEVTLTKREDSTGKYAMAGIPIDNAESYVERLLEAGYRVAVADQVQDPEEATGVVDRAVTRILTPGTLTEDELLDGERNNYVGALTADETYGLAVLDVSTGDFYATSVDSESAVADELSRFDPAEAILGPGATAAQLPDRCTVSTFDEDAFAQQRSTEHVEQYFGSADRLLPTTAEVRACGALLAYAEYVRGGEDGTLDYLNHLTRYDPQEYMLLDAVALRSLELFERRTVHGRENATLAAVIDETASALGRRTLDDWLRRPLIDRDEIATRHDAVGEFRDDVATRENVHDELRDVYDIERLISRIARGRANARDLRSLAETLDVIPQLADHLDGADCEKLKSLRERLDPLSEIRSLIDDAIQADPAREITEGDILKPSFDEELAQLRETERDGKDWIDDLEASERERTGIDSLKVGHNTVHGYYIEVTDANLDRVPEDYERRQTLKNAERYYTPELKEREDQILRAEQRADQLEYELFSSVRQQVADQSERIQAVAETFAELDVLVAFGTVAAEHDYTRPVVGYPPASDKQVTVDGIHIEDGRHPVVERTETSFVPNETVLDSTDRVAVVTGPNMSGKSTYMRQVALISILAQAGSFVPASDARLQIIDRIFTRVGASDDIAGGRSTFMVEMTELADILDAATEQSLVLLDEVGRGTSTADGFAIAQAVTECIHDEVGALTLFATHHHDLTAVADELDGAYNLYFRTRQDDDGVHFEHAIERGVADASYGVEVAATAGVDARVVDRAREILRGTDGRNIPSWDTTASDTEAAVLSEQKTNGSRRGVESEQPLSHDSGPADTELLREVQQTLAEADIATMTPLDAMNVLANLKRQVGDAGRQPSEQTE